MQNFDEYTEDEVFLEVTGITEDDFRFCVMAVTIRMKMEKSGTLKGIFLMRWFSMIR